MTKFLIRWILDLLDPQPVPVPEKNVINPERANLRKASRMFEQKKRGLRV